MKMPPFASHADLMRLLLSSAGKNDRVEPFLGDVLPEARTMLQTNALAVLRANPPQWQVIAASGARASEIPTEVVAEAVDGNAVATVDDWTAAPLGDGYALAARRPADAAALTHFAESLAAAIKAVDARQQGDVRIHRLETILTITHAWRQTNSMEALLKAMAEAATHLLHADRASIFLWDRAHKQLVGRPALGMKDGELRIADDAGIVGQVVHSGEPRRVGGGLGDHEIDRQVDALTGYKTRTIMCVPLVAPAGRVLGAFEVLNKREGHFTEEDEDALNELASSSSATAPQSRPSGRQYGASPTPIWRF
jgi:putative methionine-R-sulfoxide reductase with GAF domain